MYRGHQFPHAHLTWQQILLSLPSKSKHKWIISQDSTATTPDKSPQLPAWSTEVASEVLFFAFTLFCYRSFSTQQLLGQVMSLLHSKPSNASPFHSKQDPKTAAPYTALHVLHSCCLSNFAKLLSLSHSCSSNTGFTSLLVLNMLDTFLTQSLCTGCSSIYLHGFPLTSFKTLLK